MSAAILASLDSPPLEPPLDDEFEQPAIVVEEPSWEPRRVHVPRLLVVSVFALFVAAIAVMSAWGLAQSTWTYGMSRVGSTTTARLNQIHRDLLAAGVPEASLRHLAVAARPGINIGDAIEALVDADKDLDRLSGNPVVALARTELRGILDGLSGKRYGGQLPSFTPTPLPTLPASIPQ